MRQETEERQLRGTALKNVEAILEARQRAERELLVALPIAAIAGDAVDQPSNGRSRIQLIIDNQCSLIEERGGRAILAGGADEALDILARERVNVLVSDIGMPHKDGYGLIREIRKSNPLGSGRVPAIASTAYARADDRQRALLAGYQMHLAKPIEARELIAGVASLANLPPADRGT